MVTAALLRRYRLAGATESPLHARMRQALARMIDDEFADGDRFFTEEALIAGYGVSQATARRALADLVHAGVLERRRAKGSFVRKPTTARERALALLVGDFASSFWSSLADAVARRARALGVAAEVRRVAAEDPAPALAAHAGAPASRLGVVVIADAHTTAACASALRPLGHRLVALDLAAPGDSDAFVGVDNRAGAWLAVDHLADLGHRRVAFVEAEPAEHASVRQRRVAFHERCLARGVAPEVVACGARPGDSPFDAARAGLDRAYGKRRPPSALSACSDTAAWGALAWCADRGLAVPGDVSVIGFDDDRPSRFTRPALTTVAQPIDAIGAASVDLLCAPRFRPEHRLIAPTLVVRASTAAP